MGYLNKLRQLDFVHNHRLPSELTLASVADEPEFKLNMDEVYAQAVKGMSIPAMTLGDTSLLSAAVTRLQLQREDLHMARALAAYAPAIIASFQGAAAAALGVINLPTAIGPRDEKEA